MQKIRGDRLSVRNSVTTLLPIGALLVTLASCSSSKSDVDVTPVDISVTNFTYNRAADEGEIAAAEVFTKPVTSEQADRSMEEYLQSSGSDLHEYFPKIPDRILLGTIHCHTGHSSFQERYRLNCTVAPAELPTPDITV